MVHRLPELAEREIPEHTVSVIVENPQVIGLVQVLHDDLKVLAVLFLDLLHGHLIGDELLHSAVNRFAEICRV